MFLKSLSNLWAWLIASMLKNASKIADCSSFPTQKVSLMRDAGRDNCPLEIYPCASLGNDLYYKSHMARNFVDRIFCMARIGCFLVEAWHELWECQLISNSLEVYPFVNIYDFHWFPSLFYCLVWWTCDEVALNVIGFHRMYIENTWSLTMIAKWDHYCYSWIYVLCSYTT